MTRPPRVLWLTANLHPERGGLQTYVWEGAAALGALLPVGLVATEWQHPPRDAPVQFFSCRGLGRPASDRAWRHTCVLLRRIVEEFCPDLVHLSNAGMAAYVEALPPNTPLVATVHGNDLTAPWQPVREGVAEAVLVAGLSRSQAIYAVSEHTARLVRDRLPRAKVGVIPPGCDTSRFFPQEVNRKSFWESLGVPTDAPIILTVGRLAARKGHLTVLAALEQVKSGFHWVVAGHGAFHGVVRQAVQSSPARSRVTFLPHLPDERMPSLYNASDLFVLVPGERRTEKGLDSEGFGLVYLEAGACGKPSIGSISGGSGEAVLDGRTGLLVPPDDPGALRTALSHLLDDMSLRERLGAAALLHARNLGWNRFAKRVVDAYEEVLGEGEGAVLLARHGT